MILLYIAANWKWLLGALASAALGIALLFATIDARHWHKIADQRAATIALFKQAQIDAGKAAQAAHDAQERKYEELAHVADTTHATALADARSDADRYADAHRVPVCPGGGAARSGAPSASGSGAGVPASLPPASVISDTDLHACAGAAAYAVDAHDWALGLGKP